MIEIIIALVIGSAATAVVLRWDSVVIALRGKKLAVLGAKATGKTTLLNYLTTGILSQGYALSTDYEPTRFTAKVDEKRFHLGERWIALKQSYDTGGDTSFYGDWEKIFQDSDIVFYLVRADLLFKGESETKKRVEEDLTQIQNWLGHYQSRRKILWLFDQPEKKVLIVGTHCDLLTEWKNCTPHTKSELENKFKTLSPLHNVGVGLKMVIGSLFPKTSAEELIKLVFKQV